MGREILDSRSRGQRNAQKSEDVSELRNGPTPTRPQQKKLIAPSCDIQSTRAQGFQWQDKFLILELLARETPEKVKMCLN
jgi:hypothetical protein